MRYLLGGGVVGLALFVYGALVWQGPGAGDQAVASDNNNAAPAEASKPADATPLYLPSSSRPMPDAEFGDQVREPIVVSDCRLSVSEKRDVPCPREGVLQVVGTELKPGEREEVDRMISWKTEQGTLRFRRLREGDRVETNQLLAILDDRLVRTDLASKKARVAAAKAELQAAEKTVAEAQVRYEIQVHLLAGKATSQDEVRSAKLIMERQEADVLVKKESVSIALAEEKQAETLLSMYEIRSPIAGIIKSVFKKDGEGVKPLDTLFQIHDLARLRIDALLEAEFLPYVKETAKLVVEYAPAQAPLLTFRDHLLPVTGVAVWEGHGKSWIASASEDSTVRVYDRREAVPLAVFWHPAPVRCIACSPPGATPVCLSGDSEGTLRVWSLNPPTAAPELENKDAHRGAINCMALSPDGAFCATGGEDREICLWAVATGKLLYRFPNVHRAAITAVQFTPAAGLASAARDNTICLWRLSTSGAESEMMLDGRSGDVASPGLSADGKYVLFDQGRRLRVMRIKDRTTRCLLENAAEASHFSTFAMFSPDHRLMVTACAAEAQLQLWRAPSPGARAYPVRNLVTRQKSPPTCACFAPDGSYLVTGSQDNEVLVWPIPDRNELDRQSSAKLTLLERAVESGSRHVRLWAEVANADGHLLPGTTVTLAIYP